MPRICLPFGTMPLGRSFCFFAASGAFLLLAVGACADNDVVQVGRGGAAGIGAAPHAGAAGAHATAGNGNGGSMADAGAGGSNDEPSAGAAGSDAGAAGTTGDDGPACATGGALFVVGNYENSEGDELLLRSTATAATLALVPHEARSSAAVPQLFLVEQTCAPGNALIVRDESAYYRLDFWQIGQRFALCTSAPVATLLAARELAPANVSHAATTGCAGKPFSTFDAEAL